MPRLMNNQNHNGSKLSKEQWKDLLYKVNEVYKNLNVQGRWYSDNDEKNHTDGILLGWFSEKEKREFIDKLKKKWAERKERKRQF